MSGATDAAPSLADEPDPVRRGWSSRRTDVLVFVVAVFIVALPTASLLLDHDGDPTALLKVGAVSVSRPFVERDFADPVLIGGYGHDGQQFYVIARSLPGLDQADGHVDRLRYRARRIGLPLLVWPLPGGAPKVWGFLVINLLAVGFVAVGVARLATRLRAPPWLGIVAGLTPAMVISVQGSLADALALALAVWGMVLWRRHLGWAVLLFTCAALCRETTLAAPLACLIADRRAIRAHLDRLVLLIPIGAYVMWFGIVTVWLPAPPTGTNGFVNDLAAAFALPFRSWIAAGVDSPGILTGLILLVGSIFAITRVRHVLPELAIWLAFDAFLLIVSSDEVVSSPLNFARVAPLALAVTAIAVFMRPPPAGRSARAAR